MLETKSPGQILTTHFLCGLVVVTVLLGLPGLLAEDSVPKSPPKLEARFFQQDTPYAGAITRGIIVAQTNQFSFVLPPGFRRQVDQSEKKVSLVSTSYTCAITATIHETALDGKVDLQPEIVRQQVLSRYKGARITDEFSASIESMSGPAFEVEWTSDTGKKMTTRTAFVPYPGGHIELSMQSPTEEVRAYDHALNQLLLSFRTSPIGSKLAVQEYLSEL